MIPETMRKKEKNTPGSNIKKGQVNQTGHITILDDHLTVEVADSDHIKSYRQESTKS